MALPVLKIVSLNPSWLFSGYGLSVRSSVVLVVEVCRVVVFLQLRYILLYPLLIGLEDIEILQRAGSDKLVFSFEILVGSCSSVESVDDADSGSVVESSVSGDDSGFCVDCFSGDDSGSVVDTGSCVDSGSVVDTGVDSASGSVVNSVESVANVDNGSFVDSESVADTGIDSVTGEYSD